MGSDDSAKGLPPERQRPAPTIDLKANEVSSRAIGEEPPSAAAEADQAKTDQAKTDQAKTDQAEAAQGAAPDSPGPAGTSDQAPPPSRPLSARPMLWAAAACAAIVLFAAGLWIGVSWMNRDDQLTQIAARLMRIEAVLANAPATDAAIKMTADNVASLNKRLDEIAGSVRDARSRADNAVAATEASQKAGNVPEQARVDTEA